MSIFDHPQGHDMSQLEFDQFMKVVLGVDMGKKQSISPIVGAGGALLPIPEQALREISRDHGEVWKIADKYCEEAVAKGERWDKCIFMPTHCWVEAFIDVHSVDFDLLSDPEWREAALRDQSLIEFFGAWRLTKKIYRFDPALQKALMMTTLEGDIPCEIIMRLPEWAVYIETPGMSCDGFGASISTLRGEDPEWLTIQLMRREIDNMVTFQTINVPLASGQNLCDTEHVIGSVRTDGISGLLSRMTDEEKNTVNACLSMLLWLCSESPDVADGWIPSKPAGVKVKKAVRHFAANTVNAWEVGVRTGAVLRMAAENVVKNGASQGGTHASPRVHVRRAHWHTYRTGKKGSELVVKWISPIIVNGGGRQALPVTVCSVA